MELCTMEHVYSHPVLGSIERDYNDVVTVNEGKLRSPVFGGGREQFKEKHSAVWEHELNIARVARCHGVSWHRDGEFEMLHIRGHDGFCVKMNQSKAPRVWCGLGCDGHPQTTGCKEDQWGQEATILVMAGSAACARLTSFWEAMVMASTGGGA
uniref:Uncharacterized protein n=1 Tax=Romanomermis culicivorax TaxID=13658 RepID=A0A915I6P5_ROMCU